MSICRAPRLRPIFVAWTTTRRLSNVPRRLASTTTSTLTDRGKLHDEMSRVMGSSSTAVEAAKNSASKSPENLRKGLYQQITEHPGRYARTRQAFFNALGAFVGVVLAAQTLHTARERKKLEEQLQKVQKLHEQQTEVLQSILFQPTTTLQPIVERLQQWHRNHYPERQGAQMPISSLGWFARAPQQRQVTPAISNDETEQQIRDILTDELERLVLDVTVFDPAEREVFRTRHRHHPKNEEDAPIQGERAPNGSAQRPRVFQM